MKFGKVMDTGNANFIDREFQDYFLGNLEFF